MTASLMWRDVLAPEQFRDLPQVVAELSTPIAEFVADLTDMQLESRLLASGKVVWVTDY